MHEKINWPKKQECVVTGNDDPLPFYYIPVFGKLYRLRLQEIIDMLSRGNYRNCLEVGFGSGILFPELARRTKGLFGAEVHNKIPEVKNSAALNKLDLKLLKSSVLNLSFKDNSFDLILCASVLEHIEDIGKALGELKRILANDGELVISVPHTGAFMAFIFKAFLGLRDINNRHITSNNTVETLISQQFAIVKTKKIKPAPFLPPIYYCYLVKKNNVP